MSFISFFQSLLTNLHKLPILPKALISIIPILTLLAISAVLWSTQTALRPPQSIDWSKEKNERAFEATTNQLSATSQSIMAEIANSWNGRNDRGVDIHELESDLNLSRNIVIDRTNELQENGLIETFGLTDTDYRIHDDVKEVVGDRERLQFLLGFE